MFTFDEKKLRSVYLLQAQRASVLGFTVKKKDDERSLKYYDVSKKAYEKLIKGKSIFRHQSKYNVFYQ